MSHGRTSANSRPVGHTSWCTDVTPSATARAYDVSSYCGPSRKAPVKVWKPPGYCRAAIETTRSSIRPSRTTNARETPAMVSTALGGTTATSSVPPVTSRAVAKSAGVPSINFYTGNPALLPLVAAAGGDCISIDWRMPIDQAWEVIGDDRAVQGNLDPAALLAGREFAIRRAREILERVGGRPGHIFNCGHGLHAETDHEVVRAVAEFVHAHTA